MSINNGKLKQSQHTATESSPLLQNDVHEDQQSDRTLLNPSNRDYEGQPNQQITARRGVLIALGLWGLLFLQGM